MRFTFTAEDEYEDGDYHRVIKEFNSETWPEALMMFEEFLRGCGYIFDGSLELVGKDEAVACTKDWD